MKRALIPLVPAALAALVVASARTQVRAQSKGDAEALRFQAHHEATLRHLPPGAKKARIWLVVPREDPAQRIGEFRLTGPVQGRVTRGGTYNNRYAYFEVDNPTGTIRVAADFTVER